MTELELLMAINNSLSYIELGVGMILGIMSGTIVFKAFTKPK